MLLSANYEFQIGANIAGLVNVETLIGVMPHPWTYQEVAARFMAGDGQSYGDGLPQATWVFPYLPVSAWQVLIAWFGTAMSVSRTIRTKDSTDAYVNKACIMHRPRIGETAARGMAGYYDVVLQFTHLGTAS